MNSSVPDDWAIKTISNISKVSSSKRILQSEYVPDGIPFFRSKEVILRSKRKQIKDTLYIARSRFDELDAKFGTPKANDILVTAVGTVGTIYLIEDIEFYFKDGNLLWIKNINESVYPQYLAKYMASDVFQISIDRISGGSSQSALTIEKLSQLEFNLPPLPEQQKIVQILISVDEVIEKTQAKINKLKDLKTGMMQELLTKGIDHTEFKDSPVGIIPVGWELVRLEDICEQNVPITYGVLKPGNYVENGKPLLQVKDIFEGTILANGLHLISDELDYKYRRSRVMANDIVISLVGTIGKIAIIPEWLVLPNIHRNLGRIRTKKNRFIFHYLQSETAKLQIALSSSGSSQSALNLSSLRQILVPSPNKKEMDKIVKILDSIDLRIQVTQKKYILYKNSKKALMQDLLTGKVRVDTENLTQGTC